MNLYVFEEAANESNEASFKFSPPCLIFGEGRQLADRIVAEQIDLSITRPPRNLDFFHVGAMPVVSHALMALMQHSNVPAEFIEIPGVAKTKRFAFNCLAAKNCLDKEKTVLSEKDGFRRYILKLVLDLNKIPNSPMFVVRRPGNSPYIVTEDLKLELKSSGLKGFNVVPIEKWTNYYNFNLGGQHVK